MTKKQKNQIIRQRGKATRLKHKSMQCHVYKVKIQYNKLSKLQQQQLKMLFVQGKWFYNYLLNQQNIFNINTTNIKSIIHYDKNKQQINSQIKHIGSSIKQSILEQIKSSIKGLATRKKNGYNVGKLNYISQLKSINLKQYKVAYNIKNNRIHIQGIKGYLKVNGLQQLKDYQIANAKLLNKPTGYYIAITTFKNKQQKIVSNQSIGIDFGCTNSFTLSNGQIYSYSIKETERLKRLQTKLVSKQKHSNNRNKIILKIRKEYQLINNRKQDISNKFINYLTSNYSQIVIQDQQLKQWSANGHGKAIQHSILGRVKSKLKQLDNVKVIDKYIPTTKTCSNCEYKQQINLYTRVYQCPNCGLIINRDINSAMNILNCSQNDFQLQQNSSPMEHRLNALITNNIISQIRSSQSLD